MAEIRYVVMDFGIAAYAIIETNGRASLQAPHYTLANKRDVPFRAEKISSFTQCTNCGSIPFGNIISVQIEDGMGQEQT